MLFRICGNPVNVSDLPLLNHKDNHTWLQRWGSQQYIYSVRNKHIKPWSTDAFVVNIWWDNDRRQNQNKVQLSLRTQVTTCPWESLSCSTVSLVQHQTELCQTDVLWDVPWCHQTAHHLPPPPELSDWDSQPPETAHGWLSVSSVKTAFIQSSLTRLSRENRRTAGKEEGKRQKEKTIRKERGQGGILGWFWVYGIEKYSVYLCSDCTFDS